MRRIALYFSVCAALVGSNFANAAEFDLAAKSANDLGLDLYRQLATGDKNICLSPYSIQSALAMTFAGAEGDTRAEMARVLHFPNDDRGDPCIVRSAASFTG